jgi:HD-GYP domain
MTIVDVDETHANDRPHRNRKTHYETVETMKNLSRTHCDPELVKVFVECEHELEGVEAK